MFADKFNKCYSRIRLDRDKSFEDRLTFDVYKRKTRMERFTSLWDAHKKRLPKEAVNATFNRLFKDSVRRKDVQERVDEDREIELFRQASPTRGVTPTSCSAKKSLGRASVSIQETNKTYTKWVEKQQKRDSVVKEKRKIKEFVEEVAIMQQEEAQDRKAMKFFSVHNPISYKESPRLVDRMDDDVKHRRERMMDAAKRKEEQENDEVRVTFRTPA